MHSGRRGPGAGVRAQRVFAVVGGPEQPGVRGRAAGDQGPAQRRLPLLLIHRELPRVLLRVRERRQERRRQRRARRLRAHPPRWR